MAYWPASEHHHTLCTKSEYTHYTKELAEGVCQILENEGWRGYGKIFPTKTVVIEIP